MENLLLQPAFQLTLLLFIALAGYLLASRINQSAVVGLILVGIVVGPSILGLVTYTNIVEGLANLGAVVLLFVVGLEFRVQDILDIRNGVIAAFGVVVPWIGGYLLSIAFGLDASTAIFIGTALTATSIAITANVLRDMGKLGTAAAKTIIGAAVIDDVLSLLALTMSTEVVGGVFSPEAMVLVILKSVLFIVVAGAFGLLVVNRYIERFDASSFAKKYPEFIFIFAMTMALFYAVTAELIGLSAIIGAFIAGISFSGTRLLHSRDVEEGAQYFQIIFASIFFISLGILADFRLLTPEILLFLVVLIPVAILTKIIGCGVPARAMGMSAKDSLIIGFGMAPRGEVAMIVGLIGLEKGIIDQNIYVALVLMSLVTTIVTPLIFRNWLFKEESSAPGPSG